MNARKAGGALVAAAAVAGLAVVPVTSGAATPKKKTIKVRDFYFAPYKLTVPRRSTITWKWPSYEGGAPHNAYLKRKPKGVKRWRSKVRSYDYSYKRKLYKRGKYVVICTLHPNMQTTIRVR